MSMRQLELIIARNRHHYYPTATASAVDASRARPEFVDCLAGDAQIWTDVQKARVLVMGGPNYPDLVSLCHAVRRAAAAIEGGSAAEMTTSNTGLSSTSGGGCGDSALGMEH